jgi:hypothetical protein
MVGVTLILQLVPFGLNGRGIGDRSISSASTSLDFAYNIVEVLQRYDVIL